MPVRAHVALSSPPLRTGIGGAQSRPANGASSAQMDESASVATLDFTAFFRDEFAGVLRTIELMLRDRARAEEITQDAFVQLYLNWPKISAYERPDAWVRRV